MCPIISPGYWFGYRYGDLQCHQREVGDIGAAALDILLASGSDVFLIKSTSKERHLSFSLLYFFSTYPGVGYIGAVALGIHLTSAEVVLIKNTSKERHLSSSFLYFSSTGADVEGNTNLQILREIQTTVFFS